MTFDVVVVGGGPAGAVTALALARYGYRVALVERDAAARRRRADALSSRAAAALERLGLGGAIDRAALCAPGTTLLRWRDEDVETIAARTERATIIDRVAFDAALIEGAVRDGVRIVRPSRALRSCRKAHSWVVPLAGARGARAIEARFLVDASGRASYLSWRSKARAAPTVALHAVLYGSERPFGEMRVEAVRRAWLWGVPCGDRSVTVAAFVDKAEAAGLGPAGRAELYDACLRQAALFRECLDAPRLSPVAACDATFTADDDPVGWMSLKVGDAGIALDPLASQGLQHALRSAHQASTVVHTVLGGSGDPAAALEFYRAAHARTCALHARTTSAYYARARYHAGDPFWHARAAGAPDGTKPSPTARDAGLDRNCVVRLSSEARIGRVPAIDGDVVRWVEGIAHCRLDAPIAFLSGRPAGPLARTLVRPTTVAATMQRWERDFPPAEVLSILAWLIECGVLVRVGSS